MRHQLTRKDLNDSAAILLVRFHDLYQRRPSEGRHAQETAAKCGTGLPLEQGLVTIPEYKSPGNGPLTRLRRQTRIRTYPRHLAVLCEEGDARPSKLPH